MVKKLRVDSEPLLRHNLRQAELATGQYLVYCQKTAIETIMALKGVFPDEINWAYPEQFLTTRQMAHLASKLDKKPINISILSSNPIWATHCKMDSCIEVVRGQEHSFAVYGQDFSYIWENIQ